jgi:FMN reductase
LSGASPCQRGGLRCLTAQAPPPAVLIPRIDSALLEFPALLEILELLSFIAQMSGPKEYLVISGSLRESSRSRSLAEYLKKCYETQQVTSAFLDLRVTDLPFCDGDSAYGHPNVAQCADLIAGARVIIAATPVYNFDANAALKNLIELTGDSWENKVVGFLCAAGGSSSYMSVMGLANSLMLDFRCLIIPRFVYATRSDFNEDKSLKDEVKTRIAQLARASLAIKNAV